MPQTIVFVPGLLCTGALYGAQIEALSDAADCLVADHTRHETMDAIADHALAAAPERFDLVGLSMGGYIAFEMAARAPGRIRRLVLMDTSAHADRPEQTAFRRELVALAEAEGIDPVVDRLLPLFVAGDRLGDDALVATVRRMAHDTGVETFRRQQTAITNRRDARPDLAAIACPTLVVVGAEDRLTPPDLSREIAGAIPGARLEIVAGSGHLTTLERPAAVSALLRDFLQA